MRARESGSFTPVDLPNPQQTVARCYSLIHIGTIPNVYKGVRKGMVEKIFITFELPKLKAVFSEERGEEPFAVSLELTLSTNDNSNFSALISSWRGIPFTAEEKKNGFDPTKMLGKKALVNIGHKPKADFKGQTLDRITNQNSRLVLNAIAACPKEMDVPEMINKRQLWDWDEIAEKGFDQEKFEEIPEFLRNKMIESEEYRRYSQTENISENSQARNNEPVDNDESGW